MPELPEVATIQKQLKKVTPFKVNKMKTSKVVKSIAHTPLTKLKNATIIDVKRKGKMLDFVLDNGHHLLSHLGMTGSWRISDKPLTEKHNHLELTGDNKIISYIDPRRFGHMYLYDENETKNKLLELGIDLKDKKFTPDYIFSTLKKYPSRMIKVHLLDQKLFAGTGNYIANEICARAGILPDRLNKSLDLNDAKKMHDACHVVLTGAMTTGGTTFQGGYADTTGSKGGGVTHLVVFYQKVCQLCKKTKVIKTYLNKRGTYHCPNCQS